MSEMEALFSSKQEQIYNSFLDKNDLSLSAITTQMEHMYRLEMN